MSYLKLTTNDIYQMFAKAVEFYPTQTADYLQPQAFAAVKYREDVFETALNKTKIYQTVTANQGLFFSKKWKSGGYDINKIKYDFPLLFLLQESSGQSDHKRPLYKFKLGILDLKNRDSSVDTRADEIKMNDLQAILTTILEELIKNFIYVQVDEAGDYQWHSKEWFKSRKLDGTISSYSSPRGYLKTAFKNQNKLVFYPFEEMDNKKELNGIMATIEIQGDIEPQNYTY